MVGAIALLHCVTAIAACLWRPDQLAALTLIGPWCWLLGGLLIAPILWRLGSKRLAASLAIFWLVFALGWVEELRSFVRSAVATVAGTTTLPGQSIRVVSLNCAGSESSVADLQRTNPDIVLLQEAPGEEALARMTAKLFGATGRYCTAGDVAILAGGPVSEPIADKRGTFNAARVELPNVAPIECVSLRLDPPPTRLDFWTAAFWTERRELRQQHRRQLASILSAIGNQPDAPVIVGGDFNTLPLDAALDQMRLRFRDSFANSGLGWGGTGPNDWPIFRVDQIWTADALLSQRTVAEKTLHSDHRMVISDVNPKR
jgi:hypothetical protein